MLTTHLLVPRRRTAPAGVLSWSDFDRVFDRLWSGGGLAARAPGASPPRIDFSETDTEMRVAAELPGIEEKDIQVSLEDGVLSIRAERTVEQKDEAAEERRHVETFHGQYERSLRLPAEVDAENVKAVYRNGILTVTLPKPPEAKPQVRVIPVTSGS